MNKQPVLQKIMKLLFLHGFGQSAQLFEAKTGALRKDLIKNGFSLVFADGPFERGEGRAWWIANGDRTIYNGAEETADYLKKLHKEHKFVGVFGFSQGAGVASWISSILNPPPPFLVLCGGFLCNPPDMRLSIAGYEGRTLHIIGLQDQIITPSISLELFNIYKGQKTLLEHPNGHQIPLQSAYRKEIVAWISKAASLSSPSSSDPSDPDAATIGLNNKL